MTGIHPVPPAEGLTALQACIQDTLAEAPGMAKRWVSGLIDALRQHESWSTNPHDKSNLSAATKALLQHRAEFERRWVLHLGQAIETALQPSSEVPAPRRSLANIRFDELELMDDTQVQAAVQVARLEQFVQGAAGDALTQLTALLSRAQGLQVVKPELNPVRPDLFIQALRKTAEGLSSDVAVRGAWLHHGTPLLSQELVALYRHLTRLLDQHGVQPAGYKLIQAPVSASVSKPPGDVAPRPRPKAGVAEMLTLDQLHQLLVVGHAVASDGPVAAPRAANAQSADGRASAATPSPRVTDPTAAGYKGPERRSRGEDPAGDSLRALAHEVVRLLLDGMTHDPRLLHPVRQVVARLQPALERIAHENPRFLADRLNPARRLLEDLTQRSLAFAAEDDPGLPRFLSVLDDVVALFDRTDGHAASLFDTALELLASAQQPEDTDRQMLARGKAVASLVKVEQRFLVAERVARELSERKDMASAPAVVRQFVLGPWAQVIAQAQLDPQVGDLGGNRPPPDQRYLGVLPDLLWSTRAEVASRNRGRLVRLMPGLLRTLREGLQTIDFSATESSQFFTALMALHEAGMKGQVPAAASTPATAVEEKPAEVQSQPWLRPSEAADTGFMDAPFPEIEVDDFPATDPMPLPQPEDPGWDGPAPRLHQGAWVELEGAGGHWSRLQLTWSSPHGTMYMFTSPTNGQATSMTRRGFEKLWTTRHIRLVAAQSVVDDALDTVMDTALKNSVRDVDGTEPGDMLPPVG